MEKLPTIGNPEVVAFKKSNQLYEVKTFICQIDFSISWARVYGCNTCGSQLVHTGSPPEGLWGRKNLQSGNILDINWCLKYLLFGRQLKLNNWCIFNIIIQPKNLVSHILGIKRHCFFLGQIVWFLFSKRKR